MTKNQLKIDREGMPLVDKVRFHKYFPAEISDIQADMMLHALGADYRPYRTHGKSRYYHAYRNHYDAGGEDIELWEDLVAKGYAVKRTFYHVSVKGIHVLEYLTQCRIWDAYKNAADCRYAVLTEMMKADVYCGFGCWLPTSSQELSDRLAIRRRLILETLKELAEDGLVRKGYYGDVDEEGYIDCRHGWYLTKLAREKYAEKYEELQKAEYKRIDDSLKEGLSDGDSSD